MSTTAPPARIGASALVFVVLVAFVLRGATGVYANVSVTSFGDVHRGFDFYAYMAEFLLGGEGLQWHMYESLGAKFANRAPLYPVFLAGVWSAFGKSAVATIWCQAAVGAFGCLVPAFIAQRWGGRRAALTAGWLAALWPYGALIDTGLVEHVLFAPLSLLAVLALMRARDGEGVRGAVWAGVAASVAAMARLTFGLVMPFSVLVLLPTKRGLLKATLYCLAAFAALMPWLVRNHNVLGEFPVVGTDGGRALWLSNHSRTFARYPALSVDETERLLFHEMDPVVKREILDLADDEVAQNAYFQTMALGNMCERPGGVAWGWARKSAALWSPVYNPGPTTGGKVAVFAVSFLGLLLAGFVAVSKVPRMRGDVPVILATAVGFTAAAALFWGQSRYLAPLHGLGLAAAGAWLAAVCRWRR